MSTGTTIIISLIVIVGIIYFFVRAAWKEAEQDLNKLFAYENRSRLTPPAPPIPDDPGDSEELFDNVQAETPSVPHCSANERS